MRKNFASAFICLAMVLVSFIQVPAFAAGPSPDLAAHPLYSRYEFGKSEKIVDFAAQPLAAPVGVISEVMKRDQILKKALAAKGMEIMFHPFLKGADLNYFFSRGDVDIAMAGDLPTITLASASDIIIAGLAKQGASSVVAKKAMLLSELRGKRIGYPDGSTAHYGLIIALTSAGMKESDVKLIPMEINELSDALADGRIDAFSAWEPTPSAALARHRDFVVIQKFLNSSYLYLSRPFAERHQGAASQIIASFVRAIRWMKKEEKNLLRAAEWTLKAGADLQGRQPESSVAQIADITKQDLLQLISDPVIPRNDFGQNGLIHKGFEFLKRQGKIPSSVSWEKIRSSLDHRLMNDVILNPRKYMLNRFEYTE